MMFSMIEQESNWNPDARNDRGRAKGIAQFTPRTAKEMGLQDPYNPYDSIDAMGKYMLKLSRSVDPEDIPVAYHSGARNVRKWRSGKEDLGKWGHKHRKLIAEKYDKYRDFDFSRYEDR